MLDLETADYVIIIDKFPEISELKILLGLRAIILWTVVCIVKMQSKH